MESNWILVEKCITAQDPFRLTSSCVGHRFNLKDLISELTEFSALYLL